MKRVSGTGQTIIGVEVIVKPIEVQDPLLTIEVEIRDIAVAIRSLPDEMYEIPSLPPPIEYSPGCIVFGTSKSSGISHQVASFLKFLRASLCSLP